ncbi:MAG: hypothetical protein KAG14_00805 [Mycoplasmataceae bacterium]|nr:hypothetical protein [Mycoplasmataceae bacterium]
MKKIKITNKNKKILLSLGVLGVISSVGITVAAATIVITNKTTSQKEQTKSRI